MKDIVIITNFCASLSKSANSRFTYIADMLYKNNDVEIVSSGFSHDDKKKRVCDYSKFPNYKITLVDEPGYKKNISILRFVSHHVWGKKVYKYIKSRRKPDLIYCAIPSLTVAAKVGALIVEDAAESFCATYKGVQTGTFGDACISMRKWEPLICGGYSSSLMGNLSMLPVRFPDEIFISQKKRAMQDKAAYLNGNQDIKKKFFYMTLLRAMNGLQIRMRG